MAKIDDIFDYIFKSSMESKESSETKDKSFVVGSFLGIEIPMILLVVSLFSIVNIGGPQQRLATALLGMAILVLLVINNLPAGARISLESSDDFESMAFYVMVVLFTLTFLIAWSWSG